MIIPSYEVRPRAATERSWRWRRWTIVRPPSDEPLAFCLTRWGALRLARSWARDNQRAVFHRRPVT